MSNFRLISKQIVRLLSHPTAVDNRLLPICRQYSTLNETQESAKSGDEKAGDMPLWTSIITRSDHLEDMDNVNPKVTPIREVWLENMSTVESRKLSIVSLHPYIFGTFPRVDLIQENHKWQTLYKHIDWRWTPRRHELSGTTRKPWPQKGTGRARARGIRAPQWIGGEWCHGPRGPRTYFYLLPFAKRVKGLTSMLSTKLAQDDLKVVDTLESFPTDKPEYIEKMCQQRGWGPSVLIIDTCDIFPQNIALATHEIKHINLMPVFGLNVISMLKHETLVLTLNAVRDIEKKLLYQMRRTDLHECYNKIRSTKALHQ
ncbi:39S ribosomal protein L4, mitochondrial-like [Oppia nitens]|uniref:39S ribosomal protein L4, mitochondrial-like n=1 Tax=Oppia nitens TaxID=1686743 RepID=UPI0023DCB23C|nr:39S ribosomal protein L4, mitochondrial-like [Oppia nitens]